MTLFLQAFSRVLILIISHSCCLFLGIHRYKAKHREWYDDFLVARKYLARISFVGVFHAPLKNETSSFLWPFFHYSYGFFCRVHHRLVRNGLGFGGYLSQPSIFAEKNQVLHFQAQSALQAGQVSFSHDQQEPRLFDGS